MIRVRAFGSTGDKKTRRCFRGTRDADTKRRTTNATYTLRFLFHRRRFSASHSTRRRFIARKSAPLISPRANARHASPASSGSDPSLILFFERFVIGVGDASRLSALKCTSSAAAVSTTGGTAANNDETHRDRGGAVA